MTIKVELVNNMSDEIKAVEAEAEAFYKNIEDEEREISRMKDLRQVGYSILRKFGSPEYLENFMVDSHLFTEEEIAKVLHLQKLSHTGSDREKLIVIDWTKRVAVNTKQKYDHPLFPNVVSALLNPPMV